MAGDFAQFVAACYRLNCSGRIRGDWQTSRRTGLTSFVKACAVQRRVIGALLMREIQLRWGRRNLGFAWIFLETLIFAMPVLTMWSFMHSGMDRGGIPFIAFMWSGYLPILMFRHVTSHCLYAIRSGGALFYHRDITPFDVVFARIGLEVIGNFSATALSFYIFYIIGVIDWPQNPNLFLLGFFYMAWWSVSVAIIVAAWSERSDIVEHVWAPISYIYMPVSGFFYLAQWLPIPVRDLALTVMPSLHCYEMIRGGLFGSRLQVFYDLSYLSFVLAMLTLFGLWMMRGVRQYIQFD